MIDVLTRPTLPRSSTSEPAPSVEADPCVVVMFGASGDLAARQLVPSLFELERKGLLAPNTVVLGTARSDWSTDRFREIMCEAVKEHCSGVASSAWQAFQAKLSYVNLDVTDDADAGYARLAEHIADLREQFGTPDNLIFHLAVPPRFFGVIADRLATSNLVVSSGEDSPDPDQGWRRLIVEKPFGQDLASARALDQQLRAHFREDQIYRVDHFLGKETVQNMFAVRFANPMFEPIWNRNHVDHVQITVAESIGIGSRAGFYEDLGVVRDMVQNHLLQLVCVTAMEPPVAYDAASFRDEMTKVLQAVNVRPIDPECGAVLGQYGPGSVDGVQARGYLEEEGVESDSTTATFVALELSLDNWRWAGVPFYLRTGKRLAEKRSEVVVAFKATPHFMFSGSRANRGPHDLVFRLHPDEGIRMDMLAKQPGPELQLAAVDMSFTYAKAFGIEDPPRAYAWLLHDAMRGDQMLFARSDWVREAWEIVDPLTERWDHISPAQYPAGAWGPKAADDLLTNEGRYWRQG